MKQNAKFGCNIDQLKWYMCKFWIPYEGLPSAKYLFLNQNQLQPKLDAVFLSMLKDSEISSKTSPKIHFVQPINSGVNIKSITYCRMVPLYISTDNG